MAWDVSERRIRVAYAGRHREPGSAKKHPPEDPAEGCPGGWRRSRFVASLMPFLRLRSEHGQRVPNRTLEECDDPLVWELVNLYEREQERAIAYRIEAQTPKG